jgi:16S rRNA C967 or C1407 C5-methylase (RsmB/RsmF family)/NOL1/NOP2/fmu family ribosome biogenesis protein
MRDRLGTEAEAFFQSLSEPPNISIVLNPRKSAGHPKEGTLVPWHPQGRYLAERPSFVSDPHYHAGAYYSQEASSMLVHAIVSSLPLPAAPFCLDLCAAPGGKSLAILEAIAEQGFLISNEVIRARTRILIENLSKWGRVNWLPASAHPSVWSKQESLFDLILVDAPCSGEGMFRKEPKALSEWSEDNVTFCAQRQSSILTDVAPCLKEGGFLIYSTCTYSEVENEAMVEQMKAMGLTPFESSLPEEWGFVSIGNYAFQAYPHRVNGEGFFLTVFKREGTLETGTFDELSESESQLGALAVKVPPGYRIDQEGDNVNLYSSEFEEEIESLSQGRVLRGKGLILGTYKGKDFIPSQALAMSGLCPGASRVELVHGEAIRFLRRETFPIQVEKDGWYLMEYEGSVLGWAKVAAGRMKNHYPKEWMIRKRW